MALSIQEAVHHTGVTAHTLRYYERIGLIVDVDRDDVGHRRYREQDLRWIDFLTKLRSTGMGIERMLTYARLLREGPHTADARAQILEDHRDAVQERIRELQTHLGVIDKKIMMYRNGEMK